MPAYKLVYFQGRGRAEAARMIFNLKGVKFEDVRFDYKGNWQEEKKDTKKYPMGQLPILFVDGKPIPQSRAIVRYLAKEYDLLGANSLEMAEIDVVIETWNDIEMKFFPLFAHRDNPEKMAEMVKETKEKCVPYFTYLEQLLKNGEGKYFVNNKISAADILVFSTMDILDDSNYKIDGFLDEYPGLQAFVKAFREESPLKDYLASRPKTDA